MDKFYGLSLVDMFDAPENFIIQHTYTEEDIPPFKFKDIEELVLTYYILYDINARTPHSFLLPAAIYWMVYKLQPRIYFTDRQLT